VNTNNIGGAILYNSYYEGGTVQGRNYVGGLEGDSDSIVQSYVKGATIIGSGSYVGGLAGIWNPSGGVNWTAGPASILNDNINEIKNSYVISTTVTAELYGGGLVGNMAGGNVIDSFVSTTVLGNDNGAAFLGAFYGIDNSGGAFASTSSGLFWDSTVAASVAGSATTAAGSGSAPSTAVLSGKTTTLMQTESTFTGYDFTTPVWTVPSSTYPQLSGLPN
jgi:hypothetical protein